MSDMNTVTHSLFQVLLGRFDISSSVRLAYFLSHASDSLLLLIEGFVTSFFPQELLVCSRALTMTIQHGIDF